MRQRLSQEHGEAGWMVERRLDWTQAQTISDLVLSSASMKLDTELARSVDRTSKELSLCDMEEKN